jgi:hypothetical protein
LGWVPGGKSLKDTQADCWCCVIVNHPCL